MSDATRPTVLTHRVAAACWVAFSAILGCVTPGRISGVDVEQLEPRDYYLPPRPRDVPTDVPIDQTWDDAGIDVVPPEACEPRTFEPCGITNPCTCGRCTTIGDQGNYCTARGYVRCVRGLPAAGACRVDEACMSPPTSVDGMCISAAFCREVMVNGARGCRYSDDTAVVSAMLQRAECFVAGAQTCGAGCPWCTAGRECAWISERFATGVCVPTLTRDRIVTCRARERPWPCATDERCVRPMRGNADGVADTARIGACLPRGECLALAARFPSGYRCLTADDGP
jgi:hypothetical protein